MLQQKWYRKGELMPREQPRRLKEWTELGERREWLELQTTVSQQFQEGRKREQEREADKKELLRRWEKREGKKLLKFRKHRDERELQWERERVKGQAEDKEGYKGKGEQAREKMEEEERDGVVEWKQDSLYNWEKKKNNVIARSKVRWRKDHEKVKKQASKAKQWRAWEKGVWIRQRIRAWGENGRIPGCLQKLQAAQAHAEEMAYTAEEKRRLTEFMQLLRAEQATIPPWETREIWFMQEARESWGKTWGTLPSTKTAQRVVESVENLKVQMQRVEGHGEAGWKEKFQENVEQRVEDVIMLSIKIQEQARLKSWEWESRKVEETQ